MLLGDKLMSKRAAQGGGTIRQRSDGRWEGRYTIGRDPGTGKQIQKSIYGKTQSEVRKKLQAATAAIDNGTYLPPQKMQLSAWLDVWLTEYVQNSVKPNTYSSYITQVEKHIKPALGATQLQALNSHSIQMFYNRLLTEGKEVKLKDDNSKTSRVEQRPLSPKSVHNVHGVLTKALSVAVRIGYLQSNPADACELPRHEKKKILPLNEDNIKSFLEELESEVYKNLFIVALFTGLRQSEVLGLQWSCVDFQTGTIIIDKQLMKIKEKGGAYLLASTKTDDERLLTPAPTVMEVLKAERDRQRENQFNSFGQFVNKDNLVFTDELGKHLVARTVFKHYKNIVTRIGIPDRRFHDLRHTYATMALKSGDNIKDVQTNLGHSTSTITLDLYSHVTAEMKKASAQRMESFIKSIK